VFDASFDDVHFPPSDRHRPVAKKAMRKRPSSTMNVSSVPWRSPPRLRQRAIHEDAATGTT
jgi:hypothetical protein